MSSSDNKSDNIFEQLNSLLSSNMPDEYKTILRNFQQQGDFYSKLIQHIDNKESLENFWDLTNKQGFASIENTPDFTLIFESIKSLQSALVKITALQLTIGTRAASLFKEKQALVDSSSIEKTCQHWLQAGEEAFAEISQGDEYINAQHQLFDAIKQLMQAQQQISEQYRHYLGLPSQQSITDLQKGLHQLRTEFAEYKEQTQATIQQLTIRLEKHS